MSNAITWHDGVERFDANPTATVAVDRARWEALGATFVEVDDGDDESPGLAVGQVAGRDFGVLDYGEGETFLLVSEPDTLPYSQTIAVLGALGAAAALSLDDDIVDMAGLQRSSPERPEVQGRLAELESRIVALEEAAGAHDEELARLSAGQLRFSA